MIPHIRVDVDSRLPVYEQIRSQIAGLIQTGGLNDGDRLPSVRVLAADLGIATNTVSRAYQELQTMGYVRMARRRGTLVARSPDQQNLNPLREAAAVLAQRAHDLQVDAETALAFTAEALGLFESPPSTARVVPTLRMGTTRADTP